MDHIWTTFGPRATRGQRFAVNRIRAPRWCQPIDLRLIESRAAGNGFQCHLQLREATHRRDNIVFLERGREDTRCMCACTCKCWGWRISTRACVYVCKRERGSGNSEIEWRKKNKNLINMRMNYFIHGDAHGICGGTKNYFRICIKNKTCGWWLAIFIWYRIKILHINNCSSIIKV